MFSIASKAVHVVFDVVVACLVMLVWLLLNLCHVIANLHNSVEFHVSTIVVENNWAYTNAIAQRLKKSPKRNRKIAYDTNR